MAGAHFFFNCARAGLAFCLLTTTLTPKKVGKKSCSQHNTYVRKCTYIRISAITYQILPLPCSSSINCIPSHHHQYISLITSNSSSKSLCIIYFIDSCFVLVITFFVSFCCCCFCRTVVHSLQWHQSTCLHLKEEEFPLIICGKLGSHLK